MISRLIFFLVLFCGSLQLDVDENGYVAYCPCMGRFGNQADHFLGSLAFAKNLNRTLILPPWIEYAPGVVGSQQIPFDRYFQVAPLLNYHRVVTMERFMAELGPTLWPLEDRKVFCWSPRGSGKPDSCNAKEGNPFGPFWDRFQIDFPKSEFFGVKGLSYDVGNPSMANKWNEIYPSSRFPILAFAGAPAAFPVAEDHVKLHKYLRWSKLIADKADNFIKTKLPPGPFVGIHLRNNVDWCLGYHHEFGRLTMELCKPSKKTVLRQIKEAVKMVGAKSIFVASDKDHMITEINAALKKLSIKAFKRDPDDPHVSLAILGRSAYYLGNCVSTFSAFTKRERDAAGLKSGFWGFPTPKTAPSNKSEL